MKRFNQTQKLTRQKQRSEEETLFWMSHRVEELHSQASQVAAWGASWGGASRTSQGLLPFSEMAPKCLVHALWACRFPGEEVLLPGGLSGVWGETSTDARREPHVLMTPDTCSSYFRNFKDDT